MKNRILFSAMALLALFAVVAGVYNTGGPLAARLERQDVDLLNDLNSMAQNLRCREPDAALPMALEGPEFEAYCDSRGGAWPGFARKRADVEVTYKRLSDVTFRLCTTFHEPNRPDLQRRYQTGFDPKTGCLTRSIR